MWFPYGINDVPCVMLVKNLFFILHIIDKKQCTCFLIIFNKCKRFYLRRSMIVSALSLPFSHTISSALSLPFPHTILSALSLPFPHGFVFGNSHENFPVGHPSKECSCPNSLNFGVSMEPEASEFAKGLVL